MLAGQLKNVPLDIFEAYETRRELFANSHTIMFEFKNLEESGSIKGVKLHNDLFIRVKNQICLPITNHAKLLKQLNLSLVKHKKRVEKLKKYYMDKHYKDIERVMIVSGDSFTALPHILAYWPDYDVIKNYYKKYSLKSIDETLWAFFRVKTVTKFTYPAFTIYYTLPAVKAGIYDVRRFNLFFFFNLIDSSVIPLIYKDGVLLPEYSTLLSNLDTYDKPTIKEVVKSVVKKLTDPNFSKKDFLHNNSGYSSSSFIITQLFPYTFTLGLTDYGYVLNVYKFDLKNFKHELVLVKPVYRDYNLYRELTYKRKYSTLPERISVEQKVLDVNEVINSKYRLPYSFTGFDNEFVYFSAYGYKKIGYLIIGKLPIKDIDYIEIHGNMLTLGKDGKKTDIVIQNSDIRHCIIKQ